MLEEPIRDRRAERREATRAEILDAAWAQVRADGLAALSLRDVARTVGMQAPSLYSYFDSKNAIYDAMFAQATEEWMASRPDMPFDLEPVEGLKLVLARFVGFCTADAARYQLLFQRTIPGFEPSPETWERSVDEYQRLVDYFASLGLDQAAVDLWTALGTGLTDQQISNDPGGDRWTRLIDDVAEMFWAHVSKGAKKPTTRAARTKRRKP